MNERDTKRCTGCGALKSLGEFTARKSGGHQAACKPCRARLMREARDRDPTRHILTLMIQRCHNPNHPRYPLYGGRGIEVCERWRNSYEAFLEDMGHRPPRHSIDRIDNNGNYEPGNCRWATQRQQMQNTRRNRHVEIDGVSKTVSAWERELGVSTFGYRIRRGEQPEHAARPTRGKERLITHDGVTLNLQQWSLRLGTGSTLVTERLSRGWTEEEAVSLPPGSSRGSS